MRMIMTVMLCGLLVAAPGFAGDLQSSITRAARQAAAQPTRSTSPKNTYLWPGVALLAGGGALAVLAGTALKQTTAACVGDLFGVVCGGTEQTNKAVLWSGIAAAGLGATLLAIGARHGAHASVAVGPGRVEVLKRLTW